MTNQPTAFEEVRELKKLGIDPIEFILMVDNMRNILERVNGESISKYVARMKEVHKVIFNETSPKENEK